MLIYPFEASDPYTGGHGPGMVELLAECRRYGVVCRNLHPDNLRVADRRVRLIDYGSDVTVGSMLRTDKAVEYPVCFDRPRERRGAGDSRSNDQP